MIRKIGQASKQTILLPDRAKVRQAKGRQAAQIAALGSLRVKIWGIRSYWWEMTKMTHLKQSMRTICICP